MLLSLDFTTLRPDDYGPGEEGWFEQNRSGRHVSHYVVQIDDPQTLAYAMHDSPVGMAAWLLERRRAWSDCGGDVESRFTKDQLLTNASLYWLTETFATSVRFYAESYRTPWTPRHDRTPDRARAHRDRGVPPRVDAGATRGRRPPRRPRALDGDAPRRALRADGGAGTPR